MKKSLLLIALMIMAASIGARSQARNVESTSASTDPLPDFAYTDLAGAKRKFSEFKGKVVLIDFWATWCGPCLADMPKLRKIYDKYNAQGFEILGMNAETIGDSAPGEEMFMKQSVSRAQQLVKIKGAIWTHANTQTALPIAEKIFGVISLPTKVLVGRDGKIIARIGEKEDTEKIIAAAMEQK